VHTCNSVSARRRPTGSDGICHLLFWHIHSARDAHATTGDLAIPPQRAGVFDVSQCRPSLLMRMRAVPVSRRTEVPSIDPVMNRRRCILRYRSTIRLNKAYEFRRLSPWPRLPWLARLRPPRDRPLTLWLESSPLAFCTRIPRPRGSWRRCGTPNRESLRGGGRFSGSGDPIRARACATHRPRRPSSRRCPPRWARAARSDARRAGGSRGRSFPSRRGREASRC